jgi:hypothetical protein
MTNIIIKFANETTVVGLITDNETTYREEVKPGCVVPGKQPPT